MRWLLPALVVAALVAAMPAYGGGWSTVHRYVHATGRCGGMKEVLSSTYGAESGPRTASGERFIPNKISAASRIFPMRHWITAKNPHNGRSVRVWINDTGPYKEAYRQGAVMDFSTGAARALGMNGAAFICVAGG